MMPKIGKVSIVSPIRNDFVRECNPNNLQFTYTCLTVQYISIFYEGPVLHGLSNTFTFAVVVVIHMNMNNMNNDKD